MSFARIFRLLLPCCGGVLLFTACAGTDLGPVSRNVANAELMIQQAREDGAVQYAPMDLHMAEEHLKEAQKALEDEDGERAGRKAQTAMEKARLAQKKARAAKAEAEAREKEESLKTLKNEVNRKLAD
ncbi:MAG: hypothetical protein CSB33_02275 [Desulfobacterales bacterium]|nr:MAG: hypothetical protein CSB33_02275 [Desulfobacterales bacterium]